MPIKEHNAGRLSADGRQVRGVGGGGRRRVNNAHGSLCSLFCRDRAHRDVAEQHESLVQSGLHFFICLALVTGS